MGGDACDGSCLPTPFVVAAPAARELAYVTGPAPAAAPDGSGVVLVAWVETAVDARVIRARRYSTYGVAIGPAFDVRSVPSLGDDLVINVAGLSSGWAIVWNGNRADDDIAGISLAMVSSTGAVTFPAGSVAETTRDIQRDVRVTSLGEVFIVAWTHVRLTGTSLGSSVRFRAFGADGSPVIPETGLTTYERYAGEPAIAYAGDGHWIALWSEDDDAGTRRVMSQRFEMLTPADTTPYEVASGVHIAGPAVTTLDSGDYAVAMFGVGTSITFSGRMPSTGPPDLEDGTLHTFGVSGMRVRPTEPVIAALEGGRWMVGARLEGDVRGAFVEAGPGATLEPEVATLQSLLEVSDARGLSLVRGERDVWVLFSGTALGGLSTPRGVVGYLLPVGNPCSEITCDPGWVCDPSLAACTCDDAMGATCTCGMGLTYCNPICVDPQTDIHHCGDCATDCTSLPSTMMQACAMGTCTFTCSEEAFRDCNGDPSDGCEVVVKNNGLNCGECGVQCAGGATCTDYVCHCDVAGYVPCGVVCVDLQTNPYHCGGCDMPCDVGESCVAGACI